LVELTLAVGKAALRAFEFALHRRFHHLGVFQC
jgi:hypothetical protein